MSATYTWTFGELFPDYDTWQQFITNNTQAIDYSIEAVATFDKFCYDALSRRFAGSEIRYSIKAPFYGQLLNIYLTNFFAFKREKELIDKIYQLTEDEILIASKVWSNLALEPNTLNTPADEILNYIGQQTSSFDTRGKLDRYFQALKQVPTLDLARFFKNKYAGISFEDLFIQMYAPDYAVYYKGGK